MLRIFSLIVLILSLILIGCSDSGNKIKSDPYPIMYEANNYLVINNQIFNKKYIIHIGIYDHTRTVHRRYRVLMEVMGSTREGFLGGAASASNKQVFRGTHDDCVIIVNQIKELLEIDQKESMGG